MSEQPKDYPVAASDQMKMWMKDLADAEAGYRYTLIASGISKRQANRMTEALHAAWVQGAFGKSIDLSSILGG